MTTKSRLISKLIDGTGQVKASLLDSDGISVSSQKSVTAAAGTATYSSADTLPATATSGDQAFVTSTNRLYIYSGSGWYNIALVNNTPYWTTQAASSYDLAKDSTPTVVTVLAVDSDGTHPNYTATADSDFNQIATLSKDSDNGRIFTITPLDSENGAAVGGTGTITFKASDGISLVSTLSTFNLTFITIIDNSNYTTLLVKADTTGTDNQVDASTNAHTITESGSVTSTAFTPYHPGGYSTYFDGTDDYLGFDNGYIATNGTWWTSSGFTLEMWYYKTISRSVVLWDNRQSGTLGFMLNAYTDGYHMYNNGSWQFQSVNTEKLNQWVHVALVINGTALTLYENGISIHTDSVASTASYGYFGRSQNTLGSVQYTPRGGNIEYAGYMYDVRISDGSRYTTAFTPLDTPLENDSDTILLACSSPTLKDKSSNNHEITVFGVGISTTRFSPHDHDPYTKTDHGGSVYFDGVDDRLTVASNSDFNIGSDFTFECWCYPTSSSNAGASGNALLMLVWNGSNNSVWLSYTSGTKFEFRISYVGSWAHTLTSTDNFALNRWYHVAATRNSGTTYLFINGVQQATGSNNTDVSSTGNTVSIGSQGTGRYFQGYIKDARIVNGTAVYTSTFTPPTAPLTAITNTKLLTCTNKNDIWDAGGREALVAKTGDVTASNTQRKFTTSSAIYLDGSGDNLTMSDLEMGSGDLTFEFWMYQDVAQSSAYRCMLGASTYASSTPFTLYTYGSNVSIWLAASGGPHINAAFTATTWHHVAVVRNSGTWNLYVDGTSGGTSTTSGTYNFADTTDFRFGENLSGSYDWKGYIQGARFTKGLARYTGNFTPPTAEFDG